MIELTEEELKLAPAWATHYQLGVMGNLIFISTKKMLAWNVNTPMSMTVDLDKCSHLIDNPKPLPKTREPFDISKYKFGDINARVLYLPTSNRICFDGEIYKQDVIAIAKALGVTWDDLK